MMLPSHSLAFNYLFFHPVNIFESSFVSADIAANKTAFLLICTYIIVNGKGKETNNNSTY